MATASRVKLVPIGGFWGQTLLKGSLPAGIAPVPAGCLLRVTPPSLGQCFGSRISRECPPPRDLRTQGWKVAVATAEAWSASILCLAWRHGGRGHSLSTALWTVKRVQSNSGRTSLRCLRILIGALGGHLVYPLGLSRSVPPCRDPVCVSGGISYSFGRFLVAETLADRVFTGLGTLCAVGLANAPTGLAMQYYWVLQALRAFWAKLPSVKSKLREAVECWLR